LTHCSIPIQDERTQLKEGRQQKTDMSRMKVNKDEIDSLGDDYAANERDKAPATPVVAAPRIGRNDPCPCGSGKKYKQCHGRE
jgi:preprotein translocase subunit SecA